MAEQKVTIWKLSAIGNFSSMDVLCSNKMGTTTRDEAVFSGAVVASGGL